MIKQGEKNKSELLVEVEKYYEKCRESAAWIEHCIKHFGLTEAIKATIVHTVCKFPKEIKEFVCKKCLFVSVADGLCLYNPYSDKDQWIIILSETLGDKDFQNTVARNIAFAWLQSNSLHNIHNDRSFDEQVTLTLTAWGVHSMQQ